MSLGLPIPAGTTVCRSPVFVMSALEEWRKRVCACCFSIGEKRFSHRCTQCDQVFYCSSGC
eukprot:6234_6